MDSNLDIKIFTDGLEVIQSGIINLFKNEFFITINGINLVFEFLNDSSENAETHFDGLNEGNNTLRLKIYNMKNALLEGFYNPIRIGTINNREFLINFAAWSLDSEQNIRSVVYNLFLKKADLNG
ncbi:MAG: hypothetical protein MJY98_06710 [Fibrobacter sp.]|nr:hypothetical protein [Fibrobacter sp.]